ncbi:MAG: phenylphosphate carboxylase subunit beta [Burkholderiales bacterium]|nr:phenylphosphate carboxylase subunit beta [Burkholderiales bacterium]MBK8666511.1 phenylphosphate carboxylase subunit beta [Burkholderiales bacterium]
MDLRTYIEACRQADELKVVSAPVDWNLEISHISKLVEERKGPALLFENIKGYDTPVFTGAFATTKRLAIMLGLPHQLSMCESAQAWMKKSISAEGLIKAREVKDGPVLENVLTGDDVNLERFPVPKFFPLDGGRYIGTMVFVVLRDPETGETNLGTYRMQMLDQKTCGVQILPGKRGERIMKKYAKLGKKMPAAAVIGCDPLIFMAGTLMHKGANDFDITGTVRGQPAEYLMAPLTGLPVPAGAEIVLEGEIDPNHFRQEGPFAEYTGYYTDELHHPILKPALEVKQILHRNQPILWATGQGRPVTDVHMLLAFTRTATLWTELEQMRIPGVQSVCVLPESAGRFWAVVSVKQAYPGHSRQVADAVIGSNTGSYGIKGVITVDEDIQADDLQRVMWALSCRYDPMRGTELIKRGRSTPLDPALDPSSDKLTTSRILMDACIPYEWKQKPVEARLDEATLALIKSRWAEYGLD